jgi:hypothetical protein
MVTFICDKEQCENKNIHYNFPGQPETAMCGGCKETLKAKDVRPDLIIPETPAHPVAE